MAMATGLDVSSYGYKTIRPNSNSLLSSIFLFTVNAAAKTLVFVASNGKTQRFEKWSLADHFQYMLMLMTWVVFWVFRVFMDWVPLPSFLLGGFSAVGSLAISFPLSLTSSSASLRTLELVPYERFDGPSVQALGRALSQIFWILNEMPATSRKYQFAMAMAEKMMEENARGHHVELMKINRTALASAFERTSTYLHNLLSRTQDEEDHASGEAWSTRVIQALPLGSYLAPCWKCFYFCAKTIITMVGNADACRLKKGKQLGGEVEEYSEEVMGEKLGEELVWMTERLVDYEAVDEAMVQWSYASGLASLSLTSNPRVQRFFLKISAIIFRELAREDKVEVSMEVKFRLLILWLPLLCHGSDGLTFPVLTSLEKTEVERAINQVIGSLPAMEQEVIFSNWVKDYAISASNWPNLQLSYDRWCLSTRDLVM